MRTEMPRSSEARWYEPPRPRDWKTNPSDLQRIESAAANLRKTLINQATKANEGVNLRKNNVRIDPGKNAMNRTLTQKDRSRSMASLPTTPRTLRGSVLVGSAKSSNETYRVVRPGYLRQHSPIMRNSAMDLSATYVFRNKIRTQDEVEKILVNTPPSRQRSPSMTRYEPLPAIKHSASSMRERSTDTNCNDFFSPPPLLRSRTFDVFETKMTNLPVVEDIELEGAEGSEDDESYSGEEQDSFEDNEMSPDTVDSGVVSANSHGATRSRIQYISGKDNRYDDLFDSTPRSANVHMPVLIVTVNIEGKLLSEYLSQYMVGVRKSRPQTNSEIPAVEEEESSCSSEGSDEDDSASSPSSSDAGGSRTYSFESDDEGEEGGDSHASLNDEEAENDPASTYDGDDGENQTVSSQGGDEDEGSPASPEALKERETKLREALEDDDVIVYVKMPNDSLMLVSNPKERTLKELLLIVKETQVNGYRLVISRRGLEGSDLSKTLEELRLDDNTTLHLIAE